MPARARTPKLKPLFFNVGESIIDTCYTCGVTGPATFALRDVPLGATVSDATDVLVAVCNACQSITSIPPQSEPRLKAARERSADERLSARVPRSAEDALMWIADQLEAPDAALRSRLFTFYLRQMASEPALAKLVREQAHGVFALGVRPYRLDVRVRSEVLGPALRIAQANGVSASDLAIGVIGVAANDMRSGSSNTRRSALEIIASSL